MANKKRKARRSSSTKTAGRISSDGSAVLDNLKVGLMTKDNWIDMAWAVAGGLFYVVVPTAIQRLGVRVNPPDAQGESTYTIKWWDINGWPVFWIGAVGGLVVGAALRQPGFMAGALGTGTAHLLFTKANKPVIKKVFGIYAARLDASSTSTMGDAGYVQRTPSVPMPELQAGAKHATVNGRKVVIYDDVKKLPATTTQTTPLADYQHVAQPQPQARPTRQSSYESLGWDVTPESYSQIYS